MRQAFLCALLLAAGVLCFTKAVAADDVFLSGDIEDYIEVSAEGVEISSRDGDGKVLEISGDVGQIDTKAIPVDPGRKYKLSFRGRIEGDFTVEKNDRAHIETVQSFRRRLASSYQIMFYDANDEEIRIRGYGAGGFILTGEWYEYVNVFYAPPGTEALRIRLRPRDNTFLGRIDLSMITQEGPINPNPDFRYGELNYCGWNPSRDGRLYERPDGQVVFKPGYGGASSFFPLSAGSTYQIHGRGKGGRVNVVYYDEDGKQIHSRFLLRPTSEGESVSITPPEGTRLGRFVMYGVGILEEMRVTNGE